MKDVVLAEGIKVRTFSAPPPGFDPLTAPASVLAAHGFPPRPERQKQLALYTRFFSQLKSRFHYVEPSFRIGPRHGRIRVAPVAPAGPAVINPLWAGAQAAAPSQEAFYLVSANWTVPNISSFPGGGDQFYAWSWIGLSSFDVNTLGLFQIGLASDVSGQGASSSRSFKFFIEFFPADAVMLTNVPVGPGDTIGAVVFTDGAGAGEGGYVLANLTSGAATSGFLSAPDNITLGASDQALWVVERPTIGGSTSVLADYTQLFFSGCEGLCSGGGRYDLVGGGSGTVLTMADPDTTIWSNGVLVSDTVVECVYTGPRVW